MLKVEARWADNVIQRYAAQLAQLHQKYPVVIPRIINQVGDRAKTQVIRSLTAQTGLPRKTIVKAIGDPSRARAGKLSYDMVTRGGNIRLKYLAPKETRPGVVAMPWGKKTLFPGTFMKGGRFPKRVAVPSFEGHVYRRLTGGSGGSSGRRNRQMGDRIESGRRITQVRSGMTIPTEMTTGATKDAFLSIAETLLAERMVAAITKLLPGH